MGPARAGTWAPPPRGRGAARPEGRARGGGRSREVAGGEAGPRQERDCGDAGLGRPRSRGRLCKRRGNANGEPCSPAPPRDEAVEAGAGGGGEERERPTGSRESQPPRPRPRPRPTGWGERWKGSSVLPPGLRASGSGSALCRRICSSYMLLTTPSFPSLGLGLCLDKDLMEGFPLVFPALTETT